MTRSDEAAMTRLDDLRLQRELRELILEYTDTLYAGTYPTAHGFGLLTCRYPSAPRDRNRNLNRTPIEEVIVLRAIVYLTADKSKWSIVAQSSKEHFGILAGLQEFSKDLEREMGRMAEAQSRKRKWSRARVYSGEDMGEESKMVRRQRNGILGEDVEDLIAL